MRLSSTPCTAVLYDHSRLPVVRSWRIAYLSTGIAWPQSLSHVRKKHEIRRECTTELCGAQSDICRNPRADWRRRVVPSTGLERWCLHMRRQLQQQCHRCCIHTYTCPVHRPIHMDGPSLRELGVLDALTGQTPVGVAVSLLRPNRTSEANALSVRSRSRSRSVDTYLADSLDASLYMIASPPGG